jgi:hypothetical protein
VQVDYCVTTDQAVQNVSHKVMSEDATVSTAEGTSRLLENNKVTSKLQARYDQYETNKIWPEAIKQHKMPYKMQQVTADLPTPKRIKSYLAGEKSGQDPPASKSAKLQSAYGELLIAEAGLPFAQAQKQVSDCIVLDSAIQWIFFVGSILALDSALDFFNATAPKLLPADVSTLQSTVNTYVEAISHFKVPRFEATASVDFVDLTKAELSEDACTCGSDEIIQNIIHGVSNVKESVCTKLRL